MANGHRRAASPRRSEETRVAPEDGDEGPLFPTEENYLDDVPPRSKSNETRLAPLEEDSSNETRMGPADDRRKARASAPAKDAQKDISTELRGPAKDAQKDISTELRGPAAGRKATVDAEPKTGWLAKGEKRAAPAKAAAAPGVVRLSPLEPAGGKVAAEEEAPALRTMFANHSALLAEELRSALSKKVYGRGPHRVLRIDEPEGPSTAGGKLARQSISLVPRKGTGPSLVCGWVDVSKREAQLRNFEAVAKRYEAHHGEPLELRPEEYERFLADVEEVLTRAVIKVRVMVPEESPGARAMAPVVARRKGVPGVWVALIAALAFAMGMFVGRMPG